jgi:hypothetical protein
MLYTNGDSFTFGTGVQSNNTWPSLLAKQLNYELVNDAVPGSSNHRIVRTTLDFLSKHKPNLVVIAWSSYLRTEWPSQALVPQHIHNVDYNDRPIIQVQPNYTKYHKDDHGFVELFYKNINKEWLIDNYLNQILLLQSFLKCSKIQYVFVNALDNFDQDFYRKPKSKLVTGEFLGWPNQCFNQWFNASQRLPDGHLNEQGHLYLTEMILNHVKHCRT